MLIAEEAERPGNQPSTVLMHFPRRCDADTSADCAPGKNAYQEKSVQAAVAAGWVVPSSSLQADSCLWPGNLLSMSGTN